MTNIKGPSADTRAIVSSRHLAHSSAWELSEFEYGLIVSYSAFSRWMVHCMSAAGFTDFNPLDILVLHNVNHRSRAKRLSDICFVLNIDDTHTVSYSLKKLVRAHLVTGEKRGKETFYSTTKQGQKACAEYRKVRETCLVQALDMINRDDNDMRALATALRALSGIYDQASRAASSL